MMQQQEQDPKSSWPEVVGKTFEEAEETIKNDNSELDVRRVPEGTPVTRDFNPERVLVYVDDENKVIKPPSVG